MNVADKEACNNFNDPIMDIMFCSKPQSESKGKVRFLICFSGLWMKSNKRNAAGNIVAEKSHNFLVVFESHFIKITSALAAEFIELIPRKSSSLSSFLFKDLHLNKFFHVC